MQGGNEEKRKKKTCETGQKGKVWQVFEKKKGKEGSSLSLIAK